MEDNNGLESLYAELFGYESDQIEIIENTVETIDLDNYIVSSNNMNIKLEPNEGVIEVNNRSNTPSNNDMPINRNSPDIFEGNIDENITDGNITCVQTVNNNNNNSILKTKAQRKCFGKNATFSKNKKLQKNLLSENDRTNKELREHGENYKGWSMKKRGKMRSSKILGPHLKNVRPPKNLNVTR
ncbi:GATA zinc finger domain-containing protein 24-like [Condylostylus longicornis]|uniref:GATA zinc finger domain-containing protein 24-like n=1 Tax=Condylostylus longicornis TaxID=2530218 RepID=UPI00244E537E|nr:GATA zinc finger domain-containing protein 24-like [Condylostylus longicornis]